MNINHNIFNLRDTEVVICIISVLLNSRTNGLNHYLNIRSIQDHRKTDTCNMK